MTIILLAIAVISIIACITGLFMKNKKLILLGIVMIAITGLAFFGLLNLIDCM